MDVPKDESELDPRIQIELEKLNSATDAINSLEVELDEANTTFRMLLNESTRRLKALSKKLGSCIERARPYYEALEVGRQAQIECQRAAVQYQRANEIHQAAKETVALAEARFMSKQHEWQFDNAWQEMLNHATIKVMEAETTKTESEREHQRRALHFNHAGQKLQMLERKLWRSITSSRPYFEEKELCQQQLATQKERIQQLQAEVTAVKKAYAESLKALEAISLEIHQQRGDFVEECSELGDPGIREPGVGAESVAVVEEPLYPLTATHPTLVSSKLAKISPTRELGDLNKINADLDYEVELNRCDLQSLGSVSVATSSVASDDECIEDDSELEELKQMATASRIEPVDITLVGDQLASISKTELSVIRSEDIRKTESSVIRPEDIRKTETFESVRRLSESWERQMGETITRLGTILTMRSKNAEPVEDKRKY